MFRCTTADAPVALTSASVLRNSFWFVNSSWSLLALALISDDAAIGCAYSGNRVTSGRGNERWFLLG